MSSDRDDVLQRQIDALVAELATSRREIDRLSDRADLAEERADASEAQSSIDRDKITDLQSEGVLSIEHVEHMETALKSSRTIGAAIGVLVGSRHITEDEAFEVLKAASQRNNRKLRDLAADVVASATRGEID